MCKYVCVCVGCLSATQEGMCSSSSDNLDVINEREMIHVGEINQGLDLTGVLLGMTLFSIAEPFLMSFLRQHFAMPWFTIDISREGECTNGQLIRAGIHFSIKTNQCWVLYSFINLENQFIEKALVHRGALEQSSKEQNGRSLRLKFKGTFHFSKTSLYSEKVVA